MYFLQKRLRYSRNEKETTEGVIQSITIAYDVKGQTAELYIMILKDKAEKNNAQLSACVDSFCELIKDTSSGENSLRISEFIKEHENIADFLIRELPFIKNPSFAGFTNEALSLVKFWILTSSATKQWRDENVTENYSAISANSKEISSGVVANKIGTYSNVQQKGEVLENALLRLLQYLFDIREDDNDGLHTKTEEFLEYLKQRDKGTQNGRDLDLIYRDEAGIRRHCYFECKSVDSKNITEEQIIGKLRQAKRSVPDGEEIEHWILFAPTSKLNHYAEAHLEEWIQQPDMYYPIKDIQVWNKGYNVHELFGLVPELYDLYFQSEDQENPRNWSEEKRQQIISIWKERLKPVILLPKGMRKYLDHTEYIMPALQRDEAQNILYESLYERYVKLYFRDKNDELSTEPLEDDMMRWLYKDDSNIRVILGEFGDGKSFFLYCLCRRLLQEYPKNPDDSYIPIYFPLQEVGDKNDFHDYVRKRMELLECTTADFHELKRKRKVLICLDGFDEMSADISSGAVEENTDYLIDLCKSEFMGTKIIITSRKDCFLNNDIHEWLDEELGKTELLTIEKADRCTCEQYLYDYSNVNLADDHLVQFATIENMMELLGKPFFLEMMRQLLEEDVKDLTSETSMYNHYIFECLKRKRREGLNTKEKRRIKEGEQIDRIYQALLTLAFGIQKNGRETILKNELSTEYGLDTVEILWDMKTEDVEKKEDADNRFSMRTILKYETRVDDESGKKDRISFAHRSIREYLVAEYLLNTLLKNPAAFVDIFARYSYSFEILRFFGLLISENKESHRIEKQILDILNTIDKEDKSPRWSLPGKILQTLYYKNKVIPNAAWAEKDYSDISIQKADLSGKLDFTGSKFLNANLNNVIFDNCNLSDCDLTGAKIGETCQVQNMHYDGQYLNVYYTDGCYRRWNLNRYEEESEKQMEQFKGKVLWKNNNQLIHCADQILQVMSVYNQMLLMDCKAEDQIMDVASSLLMVKQNDNEHTLTLYDGNTLAILHEWKEESQITGLFVDNQIVLVTGTKEGLELYYVDRQESDFFEAFKNKNIRLICANKADGITLTIVFHDEKENEVLHMFSINGDICEEVISYKVEGYHVHSMCFCRGDLLAVSDENGAIHLLHIDYSNRSLHEDEKEQLKMDIYCKETVIDGLRPVELWERIHNSQNNTNFRIMKKNIYPPFEMGVGD